MPSALIARYQKAHTSGFSEFLFLKGNNLGSELLNFDHTSNYNINQSHTVYNMNHHTSPAYYDTNYYINFANADNFSNTEFSNKTNYFISTNQYESNPLSYDYPFYNKIVLPKADNDIRIKKSLMNNLYEDILMKTVHYSTNDSIIDGNRSWDMHSIVDPNKDEYAISPSFYELYSTDGLSLYPNINSTLQADISNSPNKNMMWMDSEYRILDDISTLLMHNTLDLQEMYFHNIDCHSELLFHRIIKTREGRTTPVQAFHVFQPLNMFNKTTEHIYDTQVRHGTQYAYNFFPCVAQVFHNVEIISVEDVPSTEGEMIVALEVEIRPHIKILELSAGSFLTTVVEPPPRKPIIKFSNYVNENNKIKISLSDRMGRRVDSRNRKELERIVEKDDDYIDKLLIYNRSRYTYYSDVASYGVFEIYRITEKPKSLADFDGQLLQVVQSTQVGSFNRKKLKKFYTIHNLEHGKTYYYLFRALSHDEAFSEHTAVYEVQKIKDSDETILNVSSFELAANTRKKYNTTFRKFLKLSIPDYHMVIRSMNNGTEVQTAFGSNINLALGETDLEDNLWSYNDLDSKFIKLRIESKSTGKKIDLNLVFDHNQPENN
jgi:D-Tyr-tRNAtyr deacylase